MVLLLLGISIVIIALAVVLDIKTDCDGGCLGVGGILMFLSALIASICLGIDVAQANVLNERIAMYEEENTRIEQQVADVVQQYQQYETNIFTEVNPESAMTLVALYPDLKSDTLVQSQIELYTENNEVIRELKDCQIKANVQRWWLYFGGKRDAN
jgi:hypothetical protein